MAGHGLHRVHVDRIDVRALLAVDLDADEALVHQRRDLRVLEGLALHHVAPVAGGVADRDEDRLVLAAGAGERLLAPRVPVDRVVRVLEQVGGGLCGESVRHSRSQVVQRLSHVPSSRNGHRGRRPARRPAPTRTPSRPAGRSSSPGQTPIDPGTGTLVEGDIGEQTRRCLDNLAIVAAAAGASLDDAVRCGIYVTDIPTFKAVNEAYGSYFGDAPPARSTIGVASLPLGAEVEIDAILAVPD